MTENEQQNYQEWAGLYSARQLDDESQDHSGNGPSLPAHFEQKCLAYVCFIFLQEQSQNTTTLANGQPQCAATTREHCYCCLTTKEGYIQARSVQIFVEASRPQSRHIKVVSSTSMCMDIWTNISHGRNSLMQQLNCVCNSLAKQAVTKAIIDGYQEGQAQLLPREDIALIVLGDKFTGNISGPIHFHASKAVAHKYYLQQWKKGKWTHEQFKEVNWEHLDLALKSKADNYKIWQSKQTSGFCGTCMQVGHYSGKMYQDEQCPNCGAR